MSRTRADLVALQSLPLETKIAYSIEKIKAASDFAAENGLVVQVSDSGGMDSGVLVDLCRRSGIEFKSFFVDTGLEYPEVRAMAIKRGAEVLRPKMTFRQVIEKHGWPVISKETAQKIERVRSAGPTNNYAQAHLYGIRKNGKFSKMSLLANKWRFLLDAPFKISNKCCDELKKKPLKKIQRNAVALIGTMAEESENRRGSWLRSGCNVFDAEKPRSMPLMIWTKQDVLSYVRDNSIEYASVYGVIFESDLFGTLSCSGVDRTGCVFCMFGIAFDGKSGEMGRFDRLRLSHPKLHKYAIERLGVGPVLDFLGVKFLPPGGGACTSDPRKLIGG